MAYISNEIINEIRNKTDIVDVVSRYVNLTKKGKNYIGVCPFHDDHSPSMSVSPEKQIFTCFSCGATGNVFTFVSDFEKISFSDAVRLLGEKAGISIGNNTYIGNSKRDEYFDIYDNANKFYQNSLFTNLGKNAIQYLKNRNIDRDTIKKFGIGLSVQKLSLTDYLKNKNYSIDKLIDVGLTNDNGNDIFINRIMFPIYDLAGNPVAFSGRIYNTKDTSKYINTKETDKFKKGKILYNYHIAKEHLKKNDSVIIMEGQMDVIRASTIGVNNCIATMGTALTRDHKSIIKNMTNNIVLCFDGDSAGEKATISAIELLEDTGIDIKIVRLPNDMDPDEYIIKEGKDSFLYQISNAINLIDYKMELLKKNKDFGNIKDISSYVNSALKELVYEKDDIVVELNLKKLATSFDIDYDNLVNKYEKLKNDNNNKDSYVKVNKPKKVYNRYGQAECYLIYYMLKDEKVINMVEKRVGYFPDKNIRELSNEIIYYFHKYGIINVADFISYISSRNEILNTLKEILAMNIKEDFLIDEIEDYIFVINEYHKEVKINDLNKKLKEEKQNYQDMTAISSDGETQAVNQIEKYEIETLWVKLGNHATSEGVVMKMDVTSGSSGAQDSYNLNFTVTGGYVQIEDFISSIENDSTLGFKIEEFKMAPSGNDLQATFVCKDIPIKQVSSTTTVTQNTTTDGNNTANTNTAGNNTTGNNTANAVNNTNTTNNTTNNATTSNAR